MKNNLLTAQYSSSNPISRSLKARYQWFITTPERALEQDYQAALKIKAIEEEHFQGKKVSLSTGNYSQNVFDCFQSDVEKYLTIIRIKLAEFKVSRLFIKGYGYTFIDKINFIDDMIKKYENFDDERLIIQPQISVIDNNKRKSNENRSNLMDMKYVAQEKSVLPRSIGGTINKIKTQIDPNSEEKLVENFRSSRRTTQQAIRLILLLILIPLLAQKITKQFLILPMVENSRSGEKIEIFINSELKEKAFRELQEFEEELKFNRLLKVIPEIPDKEIEDTIAKKAQEIAEEFKHKGSNAISNVLSDLVGIIAFAGVLITNKKSTIAVKSFLNDIVYGLSDSAKAFILILFTDIFVGFHSPHGWEVILESLANHLGVAANHSAIFLFIATFPVILDTIFKYWIFRYLNQISPSAVATLKNMNE